jgi:hypothetical protein
VRLGNLHVYTDTLDVRPRGKWFQHESTTLQGVADIDNVYFGRRRVTVIWMWRMR